MLDKLKQFLIERAKWKKAGKPYRLSDKIKKLFSICQKCTHFERKNINQGKCGICRCRLTPNQEILNKLAWATTRCPLEDPKWIEEEAFQHIEITEQEIQVEEELDREETKMAQLSATPVVKKKKGCGCGGKKS